MATGDSEFSLSTEEVEHPVISLARHLNHALQMYPAELADAEKAPGLSKFQAHPPLERHILHHLDAAQHRATRALQRDRRKAGGYLSAVENDESGNAVLPRRAVDLTGHSVRALALAHVSKTHLLHALVEEAARDLDGAPPAKPEIEALDKILNKELSYLAILKSRSALLQPSRAAGTGEESPAQQQALDDIVDAIATVDNALGALAGEHLVQSVGNHGNLYAISDMGKGIMPANGQPRGLTP